MDSSISPTLPTPRRNLEVCNASTGELLCEERPIYGDGKDDFGEKL